GDERRGVVGASAGVQGFEQGRFGNQRLAGSRRGADEDALIGREVGQQSFFLHRIRREGKLIEVERGELIAAEWIAIWRRGHSRRSWVKKWYCFGTGTWAI